MRKSVVWEEGKEQPAKKKKTLGGGEVYFLRVLKRTTEEGLATTRTPRGDYLIKWEEKIFAKERRCQKNRVEKKGRERGGMLPDNLANPPQNYWTSGPGGLGGTAKNDRENKLSKNADKSFVETETIERKKREEL